MQRAAIRLAAPFGVLVAILGWGGILGRAEAQEQPRHVLATGDPVPGLGRIGTGGFYLLGLADDGRLLIVGELSDGRSGLFWAGADDLEPLWLSGDTPGVTVEVGRASTSRGGTVVAPAYPNSGGRSLVFVVFAPGTGPTVVSAPALDGDGNDLCSLETPATDDAGRVFFAAEITPPGRNCRPPDDRVETAIYALAGGTLQRLIGSLDDGALGMPIDAVRLIGATSAGTVLASILANGSVARVVAIRDGALRTIVAEGEPGPSGQALSNLGPLAVNDRGDVLFTAKEGATGGVYRSDGGDLVRIDATGSVWALGDGGEVAVIGQSEVALLAPTGESTTLVRLGEGSGIADYVSTDGPLYLNRQGSAAFQLRAYRGPASLLGLRWTAGRLEQVVASGDVAAGDSILAGGGIDTPVCLAPDGRILVLATAPEGSDGLVCIDRDGPHLLARTGDPAPEGLDFIGFSGPCRFVDGDGVVFGGQRAVPRNGDRVVDTSIYRAGAGGIERLFGDGDRVANGSVIEDSGSSLSFEVNARGTIVARARAGDFGLFMRHDDRLDVVRYGSSRLGGLTDHDEFVHGFSRDALLVWRDGLVSVPFRLGASAGGATPVLDDLRVRGDLVYFSLADDTTGALRRFFYRLGDAEPREILDADVPGEFIDYTASGQILGRDAAGLRLVAPGGRTTAAVATALSPIALNDAGTMAFIDYGAPNSSRWALAISGPGPGARRCFAPPTAQPNPRPTPTATIDGGRELTGTGDVRAYVSDALTDNLIVIDGATQDALAVVPVPHHPRALAVSRAGSRVYVLSGFRVGGISLAVVDARLGRLVSTLLLADHVLAIAAGDDETTVYAALSNDRFEWYLARIDTESGTLTKVMMPPARFGGGFALERGGAAVVTADVRGSPCASDAKVQIIDRETGALLRSGAAGVSASDLALDPEGRFVYVVDPCSNAVGVFDRATAELLYTSPTDQSPTEIALGRDGRHAYTTQGFYKVPLEGPASGSVSAIDLVDRTFHSIVVGGLSDRLALTPDGALLYVTVTDPGPAHVAIIDTTTDEVSTTILEGTYPTDVVVAAVPASSEGGGGRSGSGGCRVGPGSGGSPWWFAVAAAVLWRRRRRKSSRRCAAGQLRKCRAP